jgi:hypothetical protein
MGRIIAALIACFLLSGCQKVSAGAIVRSGDQYLFDFGRISDRASVSHEFSVSNRGTRELHITGKTNSCGCVTSELSEKTIPPGGRAVLKVTFSPTAYAGERISQFVYLNTDDPDNPVFRFTIQADVRK